MPPGSASNRQYGGFFISERTGSRHDKLRGHTTCRARKLFAPASNAGVSPEELLIAIQRSKRAVRTHEYPKQ
ncbi:hypothetical protein FEE59_13080 [Herbaspirillum sp. RU 5E]|nr:hypothetical protein [Herbaspirillum sp. RU 5E]